MLNANLRTAFVIARAAVRAFGSRGGRIVNVASWTTATGIHNAGIAAYHASKAALIALTRSLADEGAPLGIGANCVAPGAMRMAKNSRFGDPARQVPVEDVAEAIAFLCDPAAAGVTGNVVLLPER
jgi:NAD(P)-dependent dehydrogenase (short-subunit alcohol dehydrogenase family)